MVSANFSIGGSAAGSEDPTSLERLFRSLDLRSRSIISGTNLNSSSLSNFGSNGI